jgi:tetratricopeptide (TPR) repeat protein
MHGRLALILPLMVPVPLSCGTRGADRPAVELITTEGIDPDVVALARRHAASVKLRPDDTSLRANLALVYEANDLWTEGVRAWEDALALDPSQPVWRYHYAICLQEHGDTAGSVAQLRQTVTEAPDFPAARHRLGEMLLDADDLDGARVEFEAAMRLASYAPDPYVGLAEVLLRRNDAVRAAQLCEQAIALDRESRRAHYDLGLAYRDLGRTSEAEAELNLGLNAAKRFLSDPLTTQLNSYCEGFSVRFAQAAALKSRGKPQEAVPILEALLRKRPSDMNVLNNLAGSYLDLGRYEAARPLLFKAKELQPGEFATYLHLAALELAQKDYVGALEHANKAVELAPTLGAAYAIRASVRIEMARLEDAYQDLKTAVSFDASSGITFGRLGQVSAKIGRLREAVGYYETSARLLPDSLPAQAGLARIYFQVGEKQKALVAFQRARKLAPNNAEVLALGVEIGAQPR